MKDLPLYVNTVETDGPALEDMDSSLSLNEKLNIIEKRIIINTLKKHGNNQTRAAQELGISESGLRYKIKNLEIET